MMLSQRGCQKSSKKLSQAKLKHGKLRRAALSLLLMQSSTLTAFPKAGTMSGNTPQGTLQATEVLLWISFMVHYVSTSKDQVTLS